MSKFPIPDLTFERFIGDPGSTPWTLLPLLYKGGAAMIPKIALEKISEGQLGEAIKERLPLICKFHDQISIASKADSADSMIRAVRNFYHFSDAYGFAITEDSLVDTYCAYADFLHRKTLLKPRARDRQISWLNQPLSIEAAYTYLSTLGTLADRALERCAKLIELTKVRHDSRRKKLGRPASDKQNLEKTFYFGHMLQDICDSITLDVVRNQKDALTIQLRSGESFERKRAAARKPEYADAYGLQASIINLRIEAEIQMFIAQTGMNSGNAFNLPLHHFFYVSYQDSWNVKDHKSRRHGKVLFKIFKNYRPHFARYLKWREALFPNSPKLFPLIVTHSSPRRPRFVGAALHAACETTGITYFAPRDLRGTRINWLLRRSGDADVVAVLAQHRKSTLIEVYEQPSQQIAMVELTKFWQARDPTIIRVASVAPGECAGAPSPVPGIPNNAPEPDCKKLSGCLWCEDHRDIDSPDYIWALATFRYLKAIELTQGIQHPHEAGSPAELAVERMDEILQWFVKSNEQRAEWVIVANQKIEDGIFHPNFRVRIEELEGNQ